jgi:Cd(II)/Pb(II)-responsive transcriptional regulator
MNDAIKIGDLAKATACPIETIRFYEREGLLPPPARSDGNFRLYRRSHVDQLRFIRNCRSLDMTLDEIRSLLAFRDAPDLTCADVNQLLDEHIGHIAERIAELKGLERQLNGLREKCRVVKAATDCGILQTLERERPTPVGKGDDHGHLRRTHK